LAAHLRGVDRSILGTVEGRIGFSRIEGKTTSRHAVLPPFPAALSAIRSGRHETAGRGAKLSSGVLQEEFRLEEQDGSEVVQKQQAGGDKNDVPVLEKALLCRP